MNEYQWKITLWSVVILLSGLMCIAVLITAGAVQAQMSEGSRYESLYFSNTSCTYYGNDADVAQICVNYLRGNEV